MVDKETNKVKWNLRYKQEKWKKIGSYDIINNISKHVTLLQIMEYLGNKNHIVSVIGNWRFYSN